MRTTLTVAPGSDLLGITIPDGDGTVNGLSIDNPSGAWLAIVPLNRNVAPNTMGATFDIPGGLPSVDVRFMSAGPDGSASVASGDTITVTAYGGDDSPGSGPGSPYASRRYIGAILVTIDGGGTGFGTVSFPVLAGDRAALVFTPLVPPSVSGEIQVSLGGVGGVLSRDAVIDYHSQMVVGYVNPDVGSTWQVSVTLTGPAGGPYRYDVFVDTELPMVAVEPGSVPLAVNASVTSPAVGQAAMNVSLPVVIASDQSAVSVKAAPARVGRVGLGITDGTNTYNIGWLFLDGGASGDHLDVVYPAGGVIPAMLGGASWNMTVSRSDIVGTCTYDYNMLVDWTTATNPSQAANGGSGVLAGTTTYGPGITVGAKILRAHLSAQIRA